MLKKSLLTVFTLTCFSTLTAIAQVPNMAGINARFNQQMADQQMQFMMQRMWNGRMADYSKTLYNPVAEYIIVLKDSTTKKVTSKINFDEQNVSYLQAVDKSKKKNDSLRVQRIYPSDTRLVKKIDVYGNYSPDGIPNDSCWLFKEVNGKIKGYTFIPNPGQLHEGYFKFIQKGDGPMLNFNHSNVMDMVSDNEKAKMKTRSNKLYQAIVEYNKAIKKD